MRKRDLLEKINKTQNNSAIVIRHTEREKIYDAIDSHDVSLTETGKIDAFNFGKQLPNNQKIRLYHSWVSRCCETAELILQGLKDNGGKGIICGKRDFLGYHFFVDEMKGQQLFNDYSEKGFIKNWFADNFDETVVLNPKKSRRKLIRSIINNFDNHLDIYVTHDWNIILLYSYIYDILEENFRWPDFLEGVFIEENNSKLKIYFDDRIGCFELKDF